MEASSTFQKEAKDKVIWRRPKGTATSQLSSLTFQPAFLQFKHQVWPILMLQRKAQPKSLSFTCSNQ